MKRLLTAIARSILNRYEGAQRFSRDRSTLWGAEVRDARFDISQVDRTELVRKARYFEKNSAIVNRLADLFEQYTVGPNGLSMMPASSDEEWNQAAATVWNEWCQVADLTSLQEFGTLQAIAARSHFIDGEVFILKTRGLERPFRPRLQLIESHRVTTPSSLASQPNIIDGIEVNSLGRPVAYHVQDGLDSSVTRRISAENIIHWFEPGRPGQYRGIPYLSPVINDLHDLDDLQKLEMMAAKEAAEIANIITNEAGEISEAGKIRDRFSVTGETASQAETTEQRTAFYKRVLGGRTLALKKGEKLEQFKSDRPNVASREYWDYLTGKICAGVGIPRLLVFPFSLQGTVVRSELDIANSYFRARSAVAAAVMRQVYVYVMGWHIQNDGRLDGAPDDWYQVSTRPPRAVNVDVGRNSSAMLAELDAGATNYDIIYGQLGLDARAELRKSAQFAAYIRQLADEFKVTPAEIRKSAGDAIQQDADTTAADAMDTEDPADVSTS